MKTPKLGIEKILKSLHAAFCHDADRQQLLQLTATKMRETGAPYDGVYLYMLHGERLILEAFDGAPTDLCEIAVGEGLRGKSNLIVLVRRGDEILGQIVVDGNELGAFDDAEKAAARRVADGLASLL